MPRSGNYNKSFQASQARDNQLTVIENESNSWLEDVLIDYPLNFNYEPMVLVLEKIGVRFTDFRKAEQLKPYILDWSPQNVLRIVGMLRKFKDMSMENFLDSNDRESFRRFI